MSKRLFQLFGLCLACSAFSAPPPVEAPVSESGKARVTVIPVHDQIGPALLFIVRRGLKEAIAQNADALVLDMNTKGGDLETTLEILEALDRFPGTKITYVNDEAGSAGAIIAAVTDEIYFAPKGVMGAAEPISSDGKDIGDSLKRKLTSFLDAKISAYTEGKGRYRADVLRAMMDPKFELKIDDVVIKAKDELLTLTDTKAMKTYGDPPQALLAAGVAKDLDALLTKRFGARGYTVHPLEITWSENAAVWLNRIAPILLGLGMLALFIEFKTPGFGVFGITGIALLAIVFLSNYVAGLSGHEPLLFFGVGVLLVMLELLFWHTAGFLGVAGIALMMISMLWSMADLWPNEPISVAWSADAFAQPLINLGLGLAIAIVLFVSLLRFLPRGWVGDRLVVQSTSGGVAQIAGVAPEAATELSTLVGRRGVAATALHPGGQVVVEGRRYEAKVEVGAIDRGAAIVVTGCSDFALTVEKANA